jgi:acetyl esterase
MKQANRPAFHHLTPEQAKDLYLRGADVLEPASPQMLSEHTVRIPSFDSTMIEMRVFKPQTHSSLELIDTEQSSLQPTLIYFHGGGFTIGSVQTHAALCKSMAAQTKLTVISVEYRLAPEYKFPTAHLDAWSACEWIYEHSADIGVDADQIFIGGDSAGGTLALFCTQQAAINDLNVQGQVLFYPGCAPEHNLNSHLAYAEGYLLEKATIDYFFGHYLTHSDELWDWRFSALISPHLDQMCPTWIGVAQCDPLRDEGLKLARELARLDKSVQLNIYPGVVHGFIKMGRFIPEALQAQSDACSFITKLIR